MHELQKILLKKLPRLGELTFWCWIEFEWKKERIISEYDWYFTTPTIFWNNTKEQIEKYCKILGHPFTHADILEALGEDWAMDWAYYLLQNDWAGSFEAVVLETEEWERNIKLPSNISDLSLPEYEETRKQLISLLK